MPISKRTFGFAKLVQVAPSVCLLVGIVLSEPSWAVDENRLWLPASHEKLYLDLKKAAEKAESLDRCVNAVRGTVDLSRSTKAHPIYRIQCRQPNLRTYNEMVDGLSFETLTTKVEKVVELSEADKEALRLEEERKKAEERQKQKEAFLKVCLTELERKTKLFQGKTMLDPSPEPSEFTLEKAKFYIDFDSVDINQTTLRYRAICIAQRGEGVDIHIRKRRESSK